MLADRVSDKVISVAPGLGVGDALRNGLKSGFERMTG